MGLAAMTVGIGLRAPHLAEIAAIKPPLGFLEIHAENYLAPYSGRRRALLELAAHYPVSVHAVGLSLGSAAGLDETHLARVAALVEALAPPLVSEHLAWSHSGGHYHNDLLPLPYTFESLAVVAANIDRLQMRLGRQILIENPSSYVRFVGDDYSEPEFLAMLVQQTGCGLLLDLNNIVVSAANHGLDAAAYLAALPGAAIGQYHLGGHQEKTIGGAKLLIDSHDAPVAAPVWDLYAEALRRFGPRPTLIEWDAELPPLATLLAEAAQATALMEERHACAA